MRQRSAKPEHLGPGFHTWLEYLEYVEWVLTGTGRRRGKPKYMALNDTLFVNDTEDDFRAMMEDLCPVDAYMARVVRSSTKYKVDASVLMNMATRYEAEIEYIRNTRPLNLPFEWCSLIVTGIGDDEFLIAMAETEPRDHKTYPELGLEPDEKFIDCSIAFYRETGLKMMDGSINRGQRLSTCPVELHFNKGKIESETTFLNAIAAGVKPTPKGEDAVTIIRNMVLLWIHSFHLAAMLRNKQIGMPPTPGKALTRRRLRKKSKHPHFEHFVVEMEVDEPDPMQEGRTMYQPHKRMHQVRGFFRHYKSGKVSWVKSHWRGDEALGVVKKDYEVTLHDDIH